MRIWRLVLTVAILCGLGHLACTKKPTESVPPMPQDLLTLGQSIYAANCTACHNVNPRLDGSTGPGVSGSSLELIERRVVYGDYPPNYKPKRQSRVMVALPHLKNAVPALHHYLNNL